MLEEKGLPRLAGTWLPCAQSPWGHQSQGEASQLPTRASSSGSEGTAAPPAQPCPAALGGVMGPCPHPLAGLSVGVWVKGLLAPRDTHTMALTPRQYRSHMLRNRGWPPMSQSCDREKAALFHHPARYPTLLPMILPHTATQPEYPACTKPTPIPSSSSQTQQGGS